MKKVYHSLDKTYQDTDAVYTWSGMSTTHRCHGGCMYYSRVILYVILHGFRVEGAMHAYMWAKDQDRISSSPEPEASLQQ